MASKKYPAVFWIAVSATLLGSLQFGYQIAVLNTSLSFIVKELSYANEAVLSSAIVLGAAFGSLCAGKIADNVGPRTAQMLNAIPFFLGSLLSYWTPGTHVGFLAGRVISGLGAGAASLLTPRYIAEICPAQLRGNLGTQHQVCINAGILLAYVTGIPYERGFHTLTIAGYAVSWWRVMIALGLVPLILQLVLFSMSPESPVWLAGHQSGQLKALHAQLWGQQGPVGEDEEEQGGVADALLAPVEEDRRPAVEGWGGLLKREYRWMVTLAVMLPVLQQASGINTVIYYSSQVFQQAGLRSPITGSILMGALNLTFTLVAAHLMDKLGRRKLLLGSFSGMGLCLLGVAVVSVTSASASIQGTLTMLLINLYVLSFAMGAGPIPWLYISEILPDRIKGSAASLGTSVNWLGNLVVTMTFTPLLGWVGLGGAYLIYGVLNLVAVSFIHGVVVETKCRTLEEIETLLILPAVPRAASVPVDIGRAHAA